eukprot:3705101-Rhodomonas_salina.3
MLRTTLLVGAVGAASAFAPAALPSMARTTSREFMSELFFWGGSWGERGVEEARIYGPTRRCSQGCMFLALCAVAYVLV